MAAYRCIASTINKKQEAVKWLYRRLTHLGCGIDDNGLSASQVVGRRQIEYNEVSLAVDCSLVTRNDKATVGRHGDIADVLGSHRGAVVVQPTQRLVTEQVVYYNGKPTTIGRRLNSTERKSLAVGEHTAGSAPLGYTGPTGHLERQAG
jgi:hypothetical protein